MFFMVTVWYPPDKVTEGGKILSSGKLPELPSFVKRLHLFVAADKEVKTYAIYEVENKKAYEGLVAISNRYVAYFKIEGFRYRMEPLLTMEEALPMIGLPPLK